MIRGHKLECAGPQVAPGPPCGNSCRRRCFRSFFCVKNKKNLINFFTINYTYSLSLGWAFPKMAATQECGGNSCEKQIFRLFFGVFSVEIGIFSTNFDGFSPEFRGIVLFKRLCGYPAPPPCKAVALFGLWETVLPRGRTPNAHSEQLYKRHTRLRNNKTNFTLRIT